MENNPPIAPLAETLLREAAFILANNGLEGDVTAAKLSQDIHAFLNRGRAVRPVGAVVITSLGGNCPVQAEGTVDGEPFYFRARGSRWSLSVGGDPVASPSFRHEEPYGTTFEAGWISEEEAAGFLWKGIALYRERSAEPSPEIVPAS